MDKEKNGKVFQLRKSKKRISSKGKKQLKKVIHKASDSIDKANPLTDKVNKNQITDTGVETIRLINDAKKKTIKGVKKSIKVTKQTVKTTKSTIKTAGFVGKTAVKATKYTAKKTAKAIKTTYKAAKTVVRVTATVFHHISIHITSLLISPVTWIAMGLVLLIMTIGSSVVLMLSSDVNTNTAKQQYAVISPVALKSQFDVEYANAIDFYNKAVENIQNGFNGLIDGLPYSDSDLEHSALCILERNAPYSVYEKSIATNNRKESLKSAFQMLLPAEEAVSIAYILLEKQENEKNGTVNGLYEITFTQDVFDTIIDKAVNWREDVYDNQKCPDENCHQYEEYAENPQKQEAWNEADYRWDAYEAWNELARRLDRYHSIRDGNSQHQYWENNLAWQISYFERDYYYVEDWCMADPWQYSDNLYQSYSDQWDYANSLPDYLVTYKYDCSSIHQLHDIDLNFFTADYVKEQLNFTAQEKQWYDALSIEMKLKAETLASESGD